MSTDYSLKKQSVSELERYIEAQRQRLLQAHSVAHCLYEVLLYAEDAGAVTYAEAAHLAAMLIDDAIEQLDSARLQPLIEAIKGTTVDQVREPRAIYVIN